MFTTYVLRSVSTGRFYIGSTRDIARRFLEHQTGIARYTRNRGPWQLVHEEQFETRPEAVRRERFLKSGQGREWLKKELNGRAAPPEAD